MPGRHVHAGIFNPKKLAKAASLNNDAKSSNKNAQLFTIYQELERRCTGTNCNQLTKDYPAVYETKLNEICLIKFYQ